MVKKKLTREFFQAEGQKGGQSAWARLGPEERSAEMKRRAVVRAENAKKKARQEARAQGKKKKP